MEQNSPIQCPNTVTVRRNPHRKARPTPSTTRPRNPYSSSSSNVQSIPSFPIDDILSIEVPDNSQPDSSSTTTTGTKTNTSTLCENLKVFIRVRPLITNKVGDHNKISRNKNVWPQNPAKKKAVKEKSTKSKTNGVCLTVKDDHSITLSPPMSFQVSKRIKSEVYQGFSFVFSENSSQGEVYEKMVSPLVEEFLRGKSGMLAALGPSGSGKTHTIFGTPRQPGMVPLALQRIFKAEPHRSFCLSIFEIYSERGKGEKILDLSPDGTESYMQQSNIKGLKEVTISDPTEAESLIGRAMLKRATAMTNTNGQSSRSQCIINIRSAVYKFDGEDEVHEKDCVLTIVDLAGAEREKRTGNQGARLLESNFINNTSMVFGLCLRSLLEHQKNPRKPLQKHFQNSLLTRYLRDYLEGKKRMTLILTVKSGEEDYLDASYLLKQASPYMKIKCDTSEESCKIACNKRQFQIPSRMEQSKRMKYCDVEIEEEKIHREKDKLPKKDAKIVYKSDTKDRVPLKFSSTHLVEKEREHQIMQNFAKALWNVLKQYNGKLEVAESEIQSLRENLNGEKARNLELEKELRDLKSSCTCYRASSVNSTSAEVFTNLDCGKELQSSIIVEMNEDVHSPHLKCSEQGISPMKCEPLLGLAKNVLSQNGEDVVLSNSKAPERHSDFKACDSMLRQEQDLLPQVSLDVHSHNLLTPECNTTVEQCNFGPRENQDVFSQPECGNAVQLEDQKSEAVSRNVDNIEDEKTDLTASENNHQNVSMADCLPSLSQSPVTATADSCSENDLVQVRRLEEEDSSRSPKIVALTPRDQVGSVPDGKRIDSSHKPFDMRKPNVLVLSNSKTPERHSNFKTCDSTLRQEQDILPQVNVDVHSPNIRTSECNTTVEQCNSGPIEHQDVYSQPECDNAVQYEDQKSEAVSSNIANNINDKKTDHTANENNPWNAHMADSLAGPSPVRSGADSCSSNELVQEQRPEEEGSSPSRKKVASTAVGEAASVPNVDSSHKPSNVGKPKRRLLPASSVLLRDIGALDIVDEFGKQKGHRNGKKQAENEAKRTQGSISLLRLLKNNLHI